MNASDPCWREYFTDAELKEIRTYGEYSQPRLDEKVKSLFSVYKEAPETGVLEFVKKRAMSLGPFDPETQRDEFKLLHVINQ